MRIGCLSAPSYPLIIEGQCLLVGSLENLFIYFYVMIDDFNLIIYFNLFMF